MNISTPTNKIPCLDLYQQHQDLKQELLDVFERVIDQTAFSGGPFVAEFEKQFASYCNISHAIGMDNGTSALHAAMTTLGIQEGDEVILPANTFIATAWGISYCGAIPVFVDCDAETWEIDVSGIEKKITSRTKAVTGVHLYGQPFDVDAVNSICKKNNLFLIEDAAQAQGAKYKDISVGGFGEMACFSFYPGKNLGACGEAGAITTNNKKYYEHLIRLRNHGSSEKYYHDMLGYNMRMGGLEAASLSVKLKYLDSWNSRRKEIAKMYRAGIKNTAISMQVQPGWADSVYHLFVVTTPHREKLVEYLNAKNIFPGFHYPVPCHLQKAYSHLGYKKGDFPNSEYLADHCLSLPMYAEMTDDSVAYVIGQLNGFNA